MSEEVRISSDTDLINIHSNNQFCTGLPHMSSHEPKDFFLKIFVKIGSKIIAIVAYLHASSSISKI